MTKPRAARWFTFTFMAALAATVVAAPATLDKDLDALKLTMRDYPDGGGVLWAAGEGVIGDEVEYLYVDSLSAQRATEAYVISLDSSANVTLTIARNYWDENLRTCTTDDSGMCGIDFRTFGDAGFKISGSADTPYLLVILSSPEVPLDTLLPSPLFEAKRADAVKYEVSSPSNSASSQSSGTTAITHDWFKPAIAILLAIIVALLVLIFKKRGTTTSSYLLFFFLVAIAPQFSLHAAEEISAEDADAMMDGLRHRRDADSTIRTRETRERGQIDSNIKKLQTRIGQLRALKKFLDGWDGLSDCSTIANPASTPRIPTFCEGDVNCKSCYDRARGEFNKVRGVFEQLRVIYRCNKDSIDKWVAFGDGVSGVHGVSALAWQREKPKIEESVSKLKKAYDDKYKELRGRLHDSMIEISVCEARHGEPDWYDRFGFVYFEFMSDKYKRVN